MRLNQYLAKHTGISRRRADEVISNNSVKVNGEITGLGYQVQETDQVEVLEKQTWKNISSKSDYSQVLLLYKPKRSVSTRYDPEGRPTIYDYLPEEFGKYKSAGRLDFMSEGLLVLTQNGDLLFSLTHPKFKTKKAYLVGVEKAFKNNQIESYINGELEIDGYKLNPIEVEPISIAQYPYLNLEPNLSWYKFTLSEGRNRQIRKMVEEFGNIVNRLIRIQHGPFKISKELHRERYLLTNFLASKESNS